MSYYINRLKNGVGSEKDFYIPKGCRVLCCTNPFALTDEEVPQPLKENGVKLMFYPYVYTLKRGKNGKLALYDISEQAVDKPTTLAFMRPDKTIPEVVINGAMLCVNSAEEATFSKDERCLADTIIKHFTEIKNHDPKQSARHELKHLENQLAFNGLAQNYGALPEELFIRSCYLDEISATIAETIGDENRSRSDNEKLVRKTFAQWMNKHGNHDVYTKENGDFQRRWDAYEATTNGQSTVKAAELYDKVLKAYFTFEINGQKHDFSKVVNPDFALRKQVQQPLARPVHSR